MIYKSVSIKNIIGRIIRSTRLQDSSYIQDMGEWIPEAMGYMRTRMVLSPQWKDINIEYYKGKLPCNLRTLTAVAYGNTRMRHFAGVAPFNTKAATIPEIAYVSQPRTEVIPEMINNIVFSLDTTAGLYWSIDNIVTDAGSTLVGTSLDSSTFTADVARLNVELNATGLGTFLATWDGSTLLITVSGVNTVSSITYHQVTLSSPELSMTIVSSSKISTAYQTNSLDTITSVEKCLSLAYSTYTYYTELDYINTSLCDGIVRIFYRAIPVDEDGFPLIPDNEDYKEALYWYIRAKMIGTGYEDTVFKYADCEARFEKHAVRAIGQIRYPSVDQMETKLEISTRLILPEDYFETFFSNPGKEGMLDM